MLTKTSLHAHYSQNRTIENPKPEPRLTRRPQIQLEYPQNEWNQKQRNDNKLFPLKPPETEFLSQEASYHKGSRPRKERFEKDEEDEEEEEAWRLHFLLSSSFKRPCQEIQIQNLLQW